MAFAPERVMIYVVRVVTVRHLEKLPGEGSSEEWEKEREARLRAASLLFARGGKLIGGVGGMKGMWLTE